MKFIDEKIERKVNAKETWNYIGRYREFLTVEESKKLVEN